MQPTLKIVGDTDTNRIFTWDANTGRIISDSDWKYTIRDFPDSTLNAEISRVSGSNQTEFWFYDGAHGEETTQTADSPRTIRKWFTSGVANGKVRSIEQFPNDGVPLEIYRASYDEKGRVIRETTATVINVYHTKEPRAKP